MHICGHRGLHGNTAVAAEALSPTLNHDGARVGRAHRRRHARRRRHVHDARVGALEEQRQRRLPRKPADLRDLLKNGINDEALWRMARRAGVQATSQKETDHVNDAPRVIGFQILENILNCNHMYMHIMYD